MLMGFIDNASPRGPGASFPDDDVTDQQASSASVLDAARAATLRYRKQPRGIGGYAWLISLGVHAAVLVGAFVALRYFFPATSTPVAVPAPIAFGAVRTPDFLLPGDDLRDGVHGGWAGLLSDSGDAKVGPSGAADLEVPAFISRDPKTIASLTYLAPQSGVDGVAGPSPSDLLKFPASHPARPAATQPGSF